MLAFFKQFEIQKKEAMCSIRMKLLNEIWKQCAQTEIWEQCAQINNSHLWLGAMWWFQYTNQRARAMCSVGRKLESNIYYLCKLSNVIWSNDCKQCAQSKLL